METLDSIFVPLLIWTVLSIVVGYVGMEKRIGFVLAFLCGMVFSPFVGLIVTMLSKDDRDVKHDNEVLTELRNLNAVDKSSIFNKKF